MACSVRPGELEGLDALECDSLAVFCWSDVRPLTGVAGFLDWRLCGALSEAILNQHFVGELQESLLMSLQSRLPIRRIFVFGLGRSTEFDEGVVDQACGHAVSVLSGAGAESISLAIPSHRRDSEKAATFLHRVETHWRKEVDTVVVEPGQITPGLLED